MKVIGITGGVGAGKSTVLSYITEHYKARVLMADEIAHDVMEPGGRCYAALREMFPAEVFRADGTLDRPKMAEVIFHDDSLRGRMNALVHPAVGEVFKEEIAKERALEKIDYCLLETALIKDTEKDHLCDEIWFIHVNREVRRERLKESRGYSDEKIDAILASQKDVDLFIDKADAVIENNGDFEETAQQIRAALAKTSRSVGETEL